LPDGNSKVIAVVNRFVLQLPLIGLDFNSLDHLTDEVHVNYAITILVLRTSALVLHSLRLALPDAILPSKLLLVFVSWNFPARILGNIALLLVTILFLKPIGGVPIVGNVDQ